MGVGASELRRKYKEKLSPENIKQLESYPGWTWDPIKQDWNEAFEYLIVFYKKNHGKQLPPHSKTKYGYDVSDWSTRIRRKYKNNKLSKEEINQLESINGWSWDPKLDQKIERWNELIYYLERYVAQKGDSVVPSTFKFSEYHLGDKVSKVRRRYFQNNLSDKEIAQLEAIPGWVWSINKQQD